MGDTEIRRGTAADIGPAVAVWAAAHGARRGGVPPLPEQEARARAHVDNPEAVLFVASDRWGEGLGGRLVVALLEEMTKRGFWGAQLWTQTDNARARRLYEGRGFLPRGREKDESGERIMHYRRVLA